MLFCCQKKVGSHSPAEHRGLAFRLAHLMADLLRKPPQAQGFSSFIVVFCVSHVFCYIEKTKQAHAHTRTVREIATLTWKDVMHVSPEPESPNLTAELWKKCMKKYEMSFHAPGWEMSRHGRH